MSCLLFNKSKQIWQKKRGFVQKTLIVNPQVHRVPWPEAWFRRRQGIHVQNQPESKQAEEYRARC